MNEILSALNLPIWVVTVVIFLTIWSIACFGVAYLLEKIDRKEAEARR